MLIDFPNLLYSISTHNFNDLAAFGHLGGDYLTDQSVTRGNRSSDRDIPSRNQFGTSAAPIVLLNLNPGYSEQDVVTHADPDFATACIRCALHEHQRFPFYLLNPEMQGGGFDWWSRKLKSLLDGASERRHFFGNTLTFQHSCLDSVASRLMNAASMCRYPSRDDAITAIPSDYLPPDGGGGWERSGKVRFVPEADLFAIRSKLP